MRQRRQTAIGRRQRRRDISAGAILAGFMTAVVLTLVIGMPLYLLTDNAWTMAGASLAGLLLGGALAGLRARSTEPLNGALVGALGYAAALAGVGVLEYGTGDETPLAGASSSEAWFYIAWGLLMVAAAMIGGAIGGRMARSR